MSLGSGRLLIDPEARTDPLEGLRRGVNAQGLSLTLLMRLDQIVGSDPWNDSKHDDADSHARQEA